MNLSSLPKIVTRPAKRLGRGHGSGKVKTSGRGTKGQKAREKVGLKFAGSSLQASWLKRLPLLRGKGKNKSFREKPVTVSLNDLNSLKVKEITLEALKKEGVISKSAIGVKVLGTGNLKTALTVKIPVSKAAKSKIEKVGGSCNIL